MRLDVRDKNYDRNPEDYDWKIFNKDLGEYMTHGIMCDDEKGEALVYVFDLDAFVNKYPKAIIHRTAWGETITATIFGNFEFRKE